MDEPPPLYDFGYQVTSGIDSSDNALQAPDIQSTLFASIQHPDTRREFVSALSMELLLRDECDWGALLSHAPRALSSLGLCFIVASTPLAHSIELPTSSELQSVRIYLPMFQGRAAFREAQTKMHKVGMYTQYICEKGGTIEKILECLEDDALAEHDLPAHLERLKSFAGECIEDAAHVQSYFSAWQAKAEAIRRVCEDKNNFVTNSQNNLRAQSHDLGTRKEWITEDIKNLKLEAIERKEDVEFHREQYQQAAKPLSRGWEGNVQRLIGSIVDGAGQVAEVGASIFAMNLGAIQHPIAQLAAPFVRSFVQSKKVQEKEPTPIDIDSLDIGFYVAQKMIAPLKCFLISLGDDNSSIGVWGMDWPAISGYSQSNMSLAALWEVVKQHEDNPELSKSNTKPSHLAKQILHRTSEVCYQINDWIRSERDFHGRRIERLSRDTINDWRHNLQWVLQKATDLAQQAHDIDSEGRTSARRRQSTHDKNSKISRLWQYRENYEASRRFLHDAEVRLRDRTQRERQAMDEFNKIQFKLENLQEGQVTMTQVREVLGACMQNLSGLQRHLNQLTTFFAELHVFIEGTYKLRGQEFVRVASGMDRLLLTKAPEERPAFKRERMETLLLQSLELRAYYAVMREISGTYVEVSKKYIMPGVDQIDQLSLVDSSSSGLSQGQIKDKTRQIAHLASEGQKKINALANKRKEGILQQLKQRRGEAEEVRQMIENAEQMDGEGDVDGDAGAASFAF